MGKKIESTKEKIIKSKNIRINKDFIVIVKQIKFVFELPDLYKMVFICSV